MVALLRIRPSDAGDRGVVELLLQRIPSCADIGGGELARGLLLAPGDPVVEGVLEPDELGLELLLDGVAVRLEGGVEHHRSHAVGEHRRVRRAEIGAVREPKIRDLVIAERRPDLVHVSGRVLRRIEPQRVAVLLLATVGESRLGLVFQRLFLGRVRSVVDVQVLVLELIVTRSGCHPSGRRPEDQSRSDRTTRDPAPGRASSRRWRRSRSPTRRAHPG